MREQREENEWFGARGIRAIYPEQEANDYEDFCIYPTFYLGEAVTNEMLNLAFSVWFEHANMEKLQELLHIGFPHWNDKICVALSKVIHRSIQMYASWLRTDICCESGFLDLERVYRWLPWIYEKHGLALLELTKRKLENQEFAIWENELMNSLDRGEVISYESFR